MKMLCENKGSFKALEYGLRVLLLCVFFSPPMLASEVIKVVKIVVMGDIDSPGEYSISLGDTVDLLGSEYGLFNDSVFDAHYEVIRNGVNIGYQEAPQRSLVLQDNDVVIISLKKAAVIVESTEKESLTIPEPDSEQADLSEAAITPINKLNLPNDTLETNNKLNTYLLQAGDILFIELPGEEGFNKDFLIDRDGTVQLPEIGQLKVAGMKLHQAEILIAQQMSEMFLGLDKLSIMLREKRLLITVLGFVDNPGEVELSSNDNIQTAINKAGGFVDGAQLDKLQLRRGEEITTFNFKRYLDTGDEKVIPELMSLDEIFVPSSPGLSNVHGEPRDSGVDSVSDRSVIKVFGEVLTPVSFPFHEGVNVMDAILRGGGVSRYANVERIRVLSGSKPKMFNLKKFLDSGLKEDLPDLLPGSTIYVPIQLDTISAGARTVYVMGQVQNPGAFEAVEGVGFLDVIADAGGPNRYADISSVRVLRQNGEVELFDLLSFTEGHSSDLPTIEAGDAVFFPEKNPDDEAKTWFKTPTDKTVKILGAVRNPGRFDWSETVDFIDYISNAGGPTKSADLAHVKVIVQSDGQRSVTEFDLQSFMESGGSWDELPELAGGTTLVIPELPESPVDNNANWVKLPKENSIYIMGAVIQPGRYAFNKDLGFLDILSAAEGPNREADLSRLRVIHRNEGSPRVSKVNLLTFFETGDESLLPKVKSGDTIFVASRSRKWTEQEPEDTVRIMGAVATSGRYEFTTNMTILDLLAEAGGPNETAYIEKILIVNNSCCEESRASTFDLVDFMKDPDGESLPVLRAGDTIFVPEVSQSNWRSFNSLVTDTGGILNVLLLLTNLGWFSP
ncbi:SLBB domain-containing protein [uncultured Endozoicomonas sp.]|uniref:SLBB domain-containing protein n=1 Tax=uncultured Endozoicomonas sp. TaxID=432652 RepID=UPI00262F8173|nr:SLBB domain-containing protein [uncultured Endozoicomonas sp.]